MRPIVFAAALCSLFLNLGTAQVSPTVSLQPTKLEAFASQPDTRVKWSKEVGRIESAEARVVITVLVVENTAHSRSVRGVRVDLFNSNTTDQVYLEEARLEPVKKALDQIDSEIVDFQKEADEGTRYRYRGAAEFWHPDQRIHTLNAAYYIAPDSSGLALSAYKAQGFRFPGHRPSELAASIGRAIEELTRR
jgi:hypothetical protein